MSFLFLLLQTAPPDRIPRIESVVPAPVQPHAADPALIWYDSFDGPESAAAAYLEYKPGTPDSLRSETEAYGGSGRAMELRYAKGSQGTGGRKLVFGDSPVGRPIRPGERFQDVYWRHYVKHQDGWTGPAVKMSRATGLASGRWTQAFILHVWSGAGDALTLDPARGVKDGRVVTTAYNDFPNLAWLGNSPSGRFPVHATEESGRWICVEARLKLNTPGRKDGLAALWVDGRLDAERSGLDFRGTYEGHGINAVFLESYWNRGSPVDQRRWYDDFVVSTTPIGPVTAPRTPTLILTTEAPCDVELATDPDGRAVAWRGSGSKGRVRVEVPLEAGVVHFGRVRRAGGTWSPWHQPFKAAS